MNLKELRAAAQAAVDALKAERKLITDKVEAEARKDFNEDEAVAHRAKSEEIKAAQLKVADFDERIREQAEEDERAGKNDAEAQRVAKATVSVTEVREQLTYQKGDGKSYFRDMAKAQLGQADEAAKDRLARHVVDVETNKEIRKAARVGNEYRNLDRNDGSGGFPTVAAVAA